MSKKDETFLVRRTCTRRAENADEQQSRPLEEYRKLPAYVLLGDPGAGKTTSFRREAEETGGEYVRARDFATFEAGKECRGKTLFIDGLDEMRADGSDGRTPLDHIRRHLDRLGSPHFRISCREADWLGDSDREALKRVSPDGEVVALHLDPLSNDDIAEILRHKPVITDADAFMRQAREHGLDGLLRNPQTLNLLAEAVGGDAWPQSRTQVYELACNKLASEKNPEHRRARREKVPPVRELLDAAGYLSAIQLLSGMAGFALDEAQEDGQHPCWNKLEEQSLPLFAALKTNLFQGDGEELRIPVHRSVAEFLGARHLAARIENHGLPFGRVLALLTGEDGGVVADLRGLAAWLAVHSHSGRRTLTERDPLGVVLYGDARDFPTEHKLFVLEALGNEAQRYPWFRSEDWAASPFGALGTADMEPALREILSSSSRDDASEALLDCVLDAIRHGDRLAALAHPLEGIVRDVSYWPVIRKGALKTLTPILPGEDRTILPKLAEDIHTGNLEDGNDELLGELLGKLYPHTIPPARLFDYLHRPKVENLIGSYTMFWSHKLPDMAPKEDVPVLLDKLAPIRPTLKWDQREYQLERLAGKLLIRGLEECGDAITDVQLYEWLGVGLDEHDHPRLDREYSERIASWLAAHPERYKAVIEHGATLCANHENPWYCMSRCMMRLYGAAKPAGVGIWYLGKAATEQRTELSQFYFSEAAHLLRQEGGKETLTFPALEFLESWVAAYPKLEPCLEPFISCRLGEWEQEHAIKGRERKAERLKHKSQLLHFYRQHVAAICDGTAYPKIFYDLAQAYNGLLHEARGDTPRARMEDFLANDRELIDAAYTGFRRLLDRNDLPSIKEIVELELKGKTHSIRPACLVGMNELFQGNSDSALQLPDDVLSRLLAFHLSYYNGDDPPWFTALAQKRPALFANALLAYVLPMLRAKKDNVSGLYQLANNGAYAEVARIALPKLLEGFPLRASTNQSAFMLAPLLKAALHHLDRKSLSSLIARKLGLGSMDAAQKVYWLACGLLLAPGQYEKKLFQHIGKSAVRRGYLANFLYNNHGERPLPDWVVIPVATLGRLIELLAPDCTPERPTGTHPVTPAMHTADMLRSFINSLSSNPEEIATQELERLLAISNLAHWRNHLRHASHDQRITRRKATFKRLGVAEVGRALANLQPASAADLTALVFDHLRDIAKKIHDGNTNDYKQYWSYDKDNRKLDQPKPENDCRDALLSDLQERLGRLGIEAQREGNYADNKRADIRVSFGGATGFNVPIEIKKDSHDDLWRAIHEQLIPKYVRDPGADGYGIYLVFWFGGKMKPPPDGSKPLRSAQELEERLHKTLLPEEAHRIQICAMDCSLP